MDENQPIKVIGIKRNTPVADKGESGVVTITCKKGKYPDPSIKTIKERLIEVGFCDVKETFDITMIT